MNNKKQTYSLFVGGLAVGLFSMLGFVSHVFATGVSVGATVPAICGNGAVEGAEACDDGNVVNGDGCSSVCAVEAAPAGPVCGNGVKEGAEACDDGNAVNGDGCSNACVIDVVPAGAPIAPPAPPPPAPEPPPPVPEPQPEPPAPQPQPEPPAPQPQPVPAPPPGEAAPAEAAAPGAEAPAEAAGPAGSDAGAAGGNISGFDLSDVQFWIAEGRLAVTPQNNTVTSLNGDSMAIAVFMNRLPRQDVARVDLTFAGETKEMNFDIVRGDYTGNVRLPSPGIYQAFISVTYQDGDDSIIGFSVNSRGFGAIVDSASKRAVSGATIELHDASAGTLWNASAYGQDNPMTAGDDGLYGFVVPNGSYRLVVHADGYRSSQLTSFRVDANVVNRQIALIATAPSLRDALQSDKKGFDKILEVAGVLGLNIAERTKAAFQRVTDFANNERVEGITRDVIAPASVGIVTLAIIPSLWSTIFPLLRFIFLQPLLLFGRRKRRDWGMVYNSLTKLPVDLAVVRLIDKKTGKVKQSRVTDKNGRYLFISEAGDYRIEVTKPGFSFPSDLLKQVQTDGNMVDIYHGEDLQVATEEKNLTPNIPLDPAGADKTPKRIVWEKRFRVFQHGMSMAGIIVSAVSLYIAPSFFVGGLLILQILLYGGFARLVKPKKPDGWGIVYDKNSTRPLANAVVRLFTKEYNKLVSTQVTDSKGRYAFLVGPSTYYVTSQKPGYEQFKSNEIDIKKSEAEAAVLKENVGLLPGTGAAASAVPPAPVAQVPSVAPIASAPPASPVNPPAAPSAPAQIPLQTPPTPPADATQQFAQNAEAAKELDQTDVISKMRDQAMYGSNDPDPVS